MAQEARPLAATPNHDEPDDLDLFIAQQSDDPEFRASLEDAHARSQLLEACLTRRTQQGLTQASVAHAMGTTQSAVSDLEAGGTDARLSTLQRYARALGLRLTVGVTDDRALESTGPAPQ
jgi:predicted XRE-type DNA-binding protein